MLVSDRLRAVIDRMPSIRLRSGDTAPAFQAQLADGEFVSLADYHGQRLLLIFVRHLACLPCQEHLLEVEDRIATIDGTGNRILVISFDALDQVREYRSKLNVSFPIAADMARTAYDAYGLTKASFLQTWHPRTLWRYVMLWRKGRKIQWPKKGSDLSQLGADFVVERDGKIGYAHYSERPDDRPDIMEIVDAIVEQDR